jgi:hypothetical protein
MRTAIVNNEIILIFEAPVIDESQLYHFHRVKPLPVFIQNRTFTLVIDANYIAISHAGSDTFQCLLTSSQGALLNPLNAM